MADAGLWRRILRGEVPAARMVEVSRAMARTAARGAANTPRRVRAIGRARPADPAEVLFDALASNGTRVVLAFSGEEPVQDELAAAGIVAGLDRWPNLVLETLPGIDHTLRPIEAQRAGRALLERELERLVASPGD